MGHCGAGAERVVPSSRLRAALAFAWALGALASPALAQTPTPTGLPFQVNSYTTNQQSLPSVAAHVDGDFLVVWESLGSAGDDSDANSIQGQRYDGAGGPLGVEFQVNTHTTSDQGDPSAAAQTGGAFVVVWESNGSEGTDSDSTSILGQRYDSNGAAAGTEFQVNAYTTGAQSLPSVAADADGDFVVAWTSVGSSGDDSSYGSIQGRLYDSSGTPLGSDFQVNTFTTGHQYAPSVAVEGDGDFVVVWQSFGSAGTDSDSSSIQGQRYASSGSPEGAEFQVNTFTTSVQQFPAVAIGAGGDFVVAWASLGSAETDSDSYSIQGQRYDSTGDAVGSEFQVNSYTTGYQFDPSVAAGAGGDFVVAWQSFGSAGTDSSYTSIQGQRYDSSGAVAGEQFQVNSFTESAQKRPAAAWLSGSDFVVAWDSYGSDPTLFDVQAERFTIATTGTTLPATTTTTTTSLPSSTSTTTTTTSVPTTTTSTTTTTAPPPTTTTSTTAPAATTTTVATVTTTTTTTTAPPTTTTTSSTTTTTLPPGSLDLAIAQVKSSKRVTLSETRAAVTKKLKVTIENQGIGSATIDGTELASLILIDWTSLPGPDGPCGDPVTVLEPPKRGFPVVLDPGKKLALGYAVTWACANDDSQTTKTADHSDFEVDVTLATSVLGGGSDSDPSDDVCPRGASGEDEGCGGKAAGVIGQPIRTDVVLK